MSSGVEYMSGEDSVESCLDKEDSEEGPRRSLSSIIASVRRRFEKVECKYYLSKPEFKVLKDFERRYEGVMSICLFSNSPDMDIRLKYLAYCSLKDFWDQEVRSLLATKLGWYGEMPTLRKIKLAIRQVKVLK